MTLAMFALAYLAVLRARWQAQPTQQGPVSPGATSTAVAKGGRISSRST